LRLIEIHTSRLYVKRSHFRLELQMRCPLQPPDHLEQPRELCSHSFMNLRDFKSILADRPTSKVVFALPEGAPIPPHYHVTEVGYVTKRFFDCGGTQRSRESCVLQLWTANDLDHQLTAEKISSILEYTQSVLPNEDLEVEVEYQLSSTTIFRVESCNRVLGKMVFQLGSKNTECLAPDRCGVDCC
jgi:hypothetical protein